MAKRAASSDFGLKQPHKRYPQKEDTPQVVQLGPLVVLSVLNQDAPQGIQMETNQPFGYGSKARTPK